MASKRSASTTTKTSNVATSMIGGFFVLFLAAGFLMALPSALQGPWPTRQALADGSWSAEYIERLERRHPLRRLTITTWFHIDCTIFRDCPVEEGVVVRTPPFDRVIHGEGEWLYLDEELENPRAPIFENLEAIVATVGAVEAAGTQIVVAVVPTKARIEPEHLPRRLPLPEGIDTRYE